MPTRTRPKGRLYDQAATFAQGLVSKDQAAELQMLAAWSDSYWGVRQEMDQFLAKVAQARLLGEAPSPAWAYQERRLTNLLDETKRQMGRYADQAAHLTTERQRAAVREGVDDAERLAREAVSEGLPGLDANLGRINPDVLEKGAGFLQDGSVLRNHLAATMPQEAADNVKAALVRGLSAGWGQDRMLREATKALGLSHTRATTILRTESIRAYRAASRATYEANADVVGGWVWHAALDARTCVACVVMHGTEHPLSATLDGHPRCRCAMVPRTRTWADLGVEGLPDTRPTIPPGKDWLEAQDPAIQRAIMGPTKFQAWQDGKITLDDMVARHDHPDWGTMRTERSLKAIQENRNANWVDEPQAQDLAPPPQVTTPEPGADWDKWETGRDVRVRKANDTDRRWAEDDLTYARTTADRDAAQVADFKALVKERQTELRAFVPDAKERAKVSRTDYTLKSRKESLAAVQKMADQSADALRQAQAKMDGLADNLPDFDPANPLKFYGDRVTLYDRSDSTAKHLQELAEDVSPIHHHLLRGHYAQTEGGGFFIGDRYITDLDDLGHLKGVQPRGWTEGSTFDEVPGVYDPGRRVCACGGDEKGHGSTSLILHEGGHALDHAHGTQGVGGVRTSASDRGDYHAAVDTVEASVRNRWSPYYRPDGNPTGHRSEAWAEGFAAWTKVRNGTPAEQAEALARALTGRAYPTPAEVTAHKGLAAYYRSIQ